MHAQVNDCTYTGLWSASKQVLTLSQDTTALPPGQYSITLAEPAFLLPAPPSMQQLQEHRSSNTAVADSICFSATVCVPVDAPELVGWQERKAAAHATEEGQQGQLQVLGTARGMCLPVKVTQQPVPCQKPGSSAGLSRVTHEERFIQVCAVWRHCFHHEVWQNTIEWYPR